MFKLCSIFPLPLYLVATGLRTIQFLFSLVHMYILCPPLGLVKQCFGLLLISSGQGSEMAARPYSGSFSSLVPLLVSHPGNLLPLIFLLLSGLRTCCVQLFFSPLDGAIRALTFVPGNSRSRTSVRWVESGIFFVRHPGSNPGRLREKQTPFVLRYSDVNGMVSDKSRRMPRHQRRMPRHQRAQAHNSTLYRRQHRFMYWL
jgi:hypothetical protein